MAAGSRLSGLNGGSGQRIPPSPTILLLQESVFLSLIESELITAPPPPGLVLAGHNCEENELFKSKQEALI